MKMQKLWIYTVFIIAAIVLVPLVKSWYLKPDIALGSQVPPFIIELQNGDFYSNEQLLGKYTLIHFWGSWCGPCRKELPELIRLYQKWQKHPKFDMLSMALEQDPKGYQSFYEEEMTWQNKSVSFDLFDASLAKGFDVRSIPVHFVVSPQARVIFSGKNVKEVDDFLENNIQ